MSRCWSPSKLHIAMGSFVEFDAFDIGHDDAVGQCVDNALQF